MLSRKKAFMALALAAAFLLPASWAVAAEAVKTRTFEVTGGSRIFSGNVTNARQQAVSDAWDEAVHRAVVSLVSSQAVQANFPVIAESVYGQAEQFVENFQPVAESQSGGSVRVLAQVTINLDALRGALIANGVLTRAEQKPVLVVLLGHQAHDQEMPASWQSLLNEGRFPAPAHEAAVSQLAFLGFLPAGDARSLKRMFADSTAAAPDIAGLARAFGAQVLVEGHSFVRSSGNSLGLLLEAYEAGVTLKAVQAETGRELASASHTLRVVSGDGKNQIVDEALREAARDAANELSEKLMASWRELGRTNDDIRLKVLSISPLTNLVSFRKELAGIAGVKHLVPRRMTDREAEMDVAFSGSADELAKLLILKNYGRFGVRVNSVAARSMEVELVAP
jgi:hypothetical protein